MASAAKTKLSSRSVSDALARLTEVVTAKGLQVFAVVDHSGEAAKVGLELRETKLLIFGSPRAGTAVASRYALSDELSQRLAGIDALTDAAVA